MKRRREDPEAMRRQIARLQLRPRSFAPPFGLAHRVDIRPGVSKDGWRVYTVSPPVRRRISRRGTPSAGSARAVYLHGGSYINEIAAVHWVLIASLVRSTGAEFTVPIYPLAPAGTAASVVPAVADLLGALVEEAGAENTIVLGDSAGGGMALAAVVELRDRSLPVPRDTILISPWLDVRVGGPAHAGDAVRDPLLGLAGLRVAGDAYRADLPADDPKVSPVDAELSGLGRLTVFTGTRDLLNRDARRLRDRMAAGVPGTSLEFHEAVGMIHDYPLMPIAEGKGARRGIRETLVG